MNISTALITVLPDFVEYRSKLGHGIAVVRVYTTGEHKILASVEQFVPEKQILPMSLTLGDITSLFRDALRRQTNTNAFGLSIDTPVSKL